MTNRIIVKRMSSGHYVAAANGVVFIVGKPGTDLGDLVRRIAKANPEFQIGIRSKDIAESVAFKFGETVWLKRDFHLTA